MRHNHVGSPVSTGSMDSAIESGNTLPTKVDQRETLGDIIQRRFHRESLFDGDSDEGSEDLDDEDHMMPGLLNKGVSYTVQNVLVQGWVSKKGTGQDLFASRAWKTRWAVLSLARVPGHDVDVPMLEIYWSESAPTPSTVIVLSSAVILPTEGPDPVKWNFYRFEIRHVKKPVNDSFQQVTRIFSCPREGRDRWVYAMNQALLDYEKAKASRKRIVSTSPPRTLAAPANESFPPMKPIRTRLSIPMSPPLPSKPSVPLPRPPLAGVNLVD
ncbi:unnamed protein product [Cylindrotheca closterium]|uniref:PH domain-containing protein n=1 Tax=Cylindrotheca closterium TaxID=2856 RepID=A0AAD2CMY3_9STRA|nr:unnamed protein product [Cylindrotheca closterium]